MAEKIMDIKEPMATETEESSIDLMELVIKVWNDKWFIVKVTLFTALAGIVIALSIPKEYISGAKLAPESVNPLSGGTSALTALTGIRVGAGTSTDALTPTLYPDIVTSTPFLIELLEIPVKTQKEIQYGTLYDYMLEGQKTAWWNAIISLPGKAIGGIIKLFGREAGDGSSSLNPYRLSDEQRGILTGLSERINITLDDKSGSATISVMMQDPSIAAVIADSVLVKLQRHITIYRTEKSRNDLEFSRKIYEEAGHAYARAQQEYARFVDRNKDVILQSYRAEQERLFNETNLAYNIYNQAAQNHASAQSKLQENVPVFTLIEPVSISPKAAKPQRATIVIALAFLGGLFAAAWVMFGRDLTNELKVKLHKAKDDSEDKTAKKRRQKKDALLGD